MFLEKIAQTVADETSKIIGYQVSIADEKGYLIGVNDPARFGLFDKLSLEVIKQKKMLHWTPRDVVDLPGIFPGSSAPIIVNNKAIGAIGVIGKAEETEKYIQLVKNHIEMLCFQYLKSEMNDLEKKTLDTLIQYIYDFDGQTENEERIMNYGKMLGYDLSKDRVCIMIEIEGLSSNIPASDSSILSLHQFQQELLELLNHHFIWNKESFLGQSNLEQYGLFVAIDAKGIDQAFIKKIDEQMSKLNQFLERKYKSAAIASIGNLGRGVQGIKESYDNSLRALRAGKRTNITPKVYYYNDWAISLEIVTNELPPNMLNELHKKIQPFLNHTNFQTLASAFIVYCQCSMNLSETARTLYIHRNSLIHRLEKIKQLTTLDPANFEHCLLLYLAIKGKV